MEEKEYLELLERAHLRIPTGSHETDRWKIPVSRMEFEGKNTIIVNFKEMVDQIKREEKHFFKYIIQGIGAAGDLKGSKAVLKGKQKQNSIDRLINEYCEKYVVCETCKKPDTVIIKEGRNHVLVCQACGTRHPVKL